MLNLFLFGCLVYYISNRVSLLECCYCCIAVLTRTCFVLIYQHLARGRNSFFKEIIMFCESCTLYCLSYVVYCLYISSIFVAASFSYFVLKSYNLSKVKSCLGGSFFLLPKLFCLRYNVTCT